MEFKIINAPQKDKSINLHESGVTVLIGRNGSGKSKILNGIKSGKGEHVVFLRGNYENVENIETISLTNVEANQRREGVPVGVSSIVASDPHLLKIFQFFFKSLFNKELKIEGNRFKVNDYFLNEDADGYKAIFNIIYYLISPHKFILLDEPERFFHPSLSTIFLNMLSEIAKNYQKTIVISTHSSQLIRFDLPNVYMYRVSNDPPKLDNISDWIMNSSTDKYNTPKQKEIFLDWFYYHSDLIFSSVLILVEGVSDQIVMSALKQRLSIENKFETIVIKYVASSHHEDGGKSRLHKMQKHCESLLPTYSISDSDILKDEISRWCDCVANEHKDESIRKATENNLFILSKGTIEDYYFCDEDSVFCKNIKEAKKNKIPAAYEQSRLILTKPLHEIEQRFEEVIGFLKVSSQTKTDEDVILKSLAKEYLVDKHLKKNISFPHISDEEDEANFKIKFNFTSSTHGYEYPKQSLQDLMKIGNDLDTKLKR